MGLRIWRGGHGRWLGWQQIVTSQTTHKRSWGHHKCAETPAVERLGEASILRLSCHVGLHGLPPWPGVPSCLLLRSLEARLLEQLTFDLPCEILRARITLSTVFGSTLFILPLYAIFVIMTLIYFMKFGALRVHTVFKCLAYSS